MGGEYYINTTNIIIISGISISSGSKVPKLTVSK